MASDRPTTADPTRTSPDHAGIVLTAIVLAAVACNINLSVANVALPDIGNEFGADQTSLNLVAVGAGLGMSMSVLYFGAIADRFGRKQLLLLGLALTILASFLSAFAPSIELLIAARVFTGLAAGMAYPTTLSLITALWAQGTGRTTAIALWTGIGGMASVASGILAGLLLSALWWGAAFLIAAPIALVAIIAVMRSVPSHVAESTERVDHAGGVLSVLGIAALVLGISVVFAPGSTALGLGLLGASVLILLLFGWRQVRAANPLYDLSVARRRLFWAPATAGLIVFGGLIGAMFVGEQFMQNVLGYSALGAGLAVVPAAVGLVVMSPVSAKLVTAKGTRTTMLVGYALVIVAFAAMLAWRETTGYPLIGFAFLAAGCGVSFVMTSASRALTSSTPVRRVGMASATSDLQSDLGGSLMQAFLGAILAAGFAGQFAALIASSPDGKGLSSDVTRALQASFASAKRIADQYPQYHDEILSAARDSLLAGSLGAYLIGAGALVVGALIVRFAVPNAKTEAALLEQYARARD